MGRAINKTVTIVELIKVWFLFVWLTFYLSTLAWSPWKTVLSLFPEKNCWSSSEYFNWIHRHNWHMGAPRGRPFAVRASWTVVTVISFALSDDTFHSFIIYDSEFSCFLCSLETTRHVSMILITLSKNELNTSSPGWVHNCSCLLSGCWPCRNIQNDFFFLLFLLLKIKVF